MVLKLKISKSKRKGLRCVKKKLQEVSMELFIKEVRKYFIVLWTMQRDVTFRPEREQILNTYMI